MASTYVNDLRLEEIGTGEQSGTWGATTNTNLELIAEAFSYGSEAIANASTHTITVADGASDEARSFYLKCTGGGQASTVTLAPNTLSKVWMIENATSYTLTFSQGSGANVAIPAGQVKLIATDGGGSTAVVYDLLTDTNLAGTTVYSALNDGTTTLTSTVAELNILDGVTSTAAELNILDGVTSTAAEINLIDGGTSRGTTAVASGDGILINDAGTMRMTNVDTVSTYFSSHNVGGGNVVTTGALNSGSITSGFGAIDNGSSAITTTGAITGGSITVDDIGVDGKVITMTGSSGDTAVFTVAADGALSIVTTDTAAASANIQITADGTAELAGTAITLDSSGDIILDAAGNNVTVKSGGTSILDVVNGSGDVDLIVKTADKNLAIKGTDGASAITALDIDMALNGKATFSGDVVVTGDLTISGDDLVMGTNTSGHILVADGTNFNPTAVGDLSEISTAANDDVFLAIDTSGGGLKKITRSTVLAGTGSSDDLANVVEDTTPQLGGNLDMNGADIVTVSNATLDLAPNGTGTVVVRGNTNSGAIVFNCESNSHGQKVFAQPHSASVTNTLMLPAGADSTLVSLVSTDTLTNKTLTSPKINEDVAVTSTATELNLLDGVTSTTAELNVLDGITAVVGELNALDIGSTAVGTAVASKAVILDSNKDYTGIRNFTISGNLSVAGTTTTVDTVTMEAENAIVFEGATADAHETTLTIVDPTADRTINLPNQSGTIPVLAAASNTAVTSTPEELNILDGATVVVGEINALDIGSTAVGTAVASKAVILDSNKDYTGIRNLTVSGELDAATGDFSGNVDVDGTLEADAITLDGTALGSIFSPIAGGSGILTTGALDTGSITSGFGAIDNGASNITNGGLVHLDVDSDADDITGDSATGRLAIGAGQDLNLYHGGTHSYIVNDTGNLVINTGASDADIAFSGNDGGSAITALTLDMSAAGQAAFNAGATFGASVTAETDTDTSNSGSVTLDYAAHQNFVLTMTGNVTLANPSTEVVGQSGFISFIQDGTGSRVLSVGSQYFCAGGEVIVLSTAANSIDIVPYVVIAAGKICLGAPQLAFADAS